MLAVAEGRRTTALVALLLGLWTLGSPLGLGLCLCRACPEHTKLPSRGSSGRLTAPGRDAVIDSVCTCGSRELAGFESSPQSAQVQLSPHAPAVAVPPLAAHTSRCSAFSRISSDRHLPAIFVPEIAGARAPPAA